MDPLKGGASSCAKQSSNLTHVDFRGTERGVVDPHRSGSPTWPAHPIQPPTRRAPYPSSSTPASLIVADIVDGRQHPTFPLPLNLLGGRRALVPRTTPGSPASLNPQPHVPAHPPPSMSIAHLAKSAPTTQCPKPTHLTRAPSRMASHRTFHRSYSKASTCCRDLGAEDT